MNHSGLAIVQAARLAGTADAFASALEWDAFAQFPRDHAATVAAEGVARSAAPGLVSVKTTPARVAFRVEKPRAYDGQELVSLLDSMGEAQPRQLKRFGAPVVAPVSVCDPESSRLKKLRMHVGFAARGHAIGGKPGHRYYAAMFTLTYVGVDDWRPDHLTRCMDKARAWCKRRRIAFRYVWVAELQKRGAIHYHVMVWLPEGVQMPKWDECGWWPHGFTKSERARNAVPYLLKYLSKDASKSFGTFPLGARLYGVGGLDGPIRRARAWLNRPRFAQCRGSINDTCKRATGGGFLEASANLIGPPRPWQSEYECVTVAHKRGFVRVRQHPVVIDAAGPFSWLHDAPGVLCH